MITRSNGVAGIVTFLTDFGSRDGYVSSMKGIVLQHAPLTQLIDISHDVPPFDLRAASLILEGAVSSFPQGTIHLVVVDPGVGSIRRHILVETREQIFIGPDNGILGRIAALNNGNAFEIDLLRLGVPNPSGTFHGRDVYAFVAGKLLAGKKYQEFTTPISKPIVLQIPEPVRTADGLLGEVIYKDGFGNLCTNFRNEHYSRDFVFRLNGIVLNKVTHYSALEPDETGVILNSWGYFEITRRETNAAKILGINEGAKVLLERISSQKESTK